MLPARMVGAAEEGGMVPRLAGREPRGHRAEYFRGHCRCSCGLDAASQDIAMPAAAKVYRLGFGIGRGESLQFFSRLETHGLARRNADLLAGAGVAANAGLASLDVEDTEAAQLDAIPASQSVLHRFKHGFDGLLGLRPRNIRF